MVRRTHAPARDPLERPRPPRPTSGRLGRADTDGGVGRAGPGRAGEAAGLAVSAHLLGCALNDGRSARRSRTAGSGPADAYADRPDGGGVDAEVAVLLHVLGGPPGAVGGRPRERQVPALRRAGLRT